MRLGKLAAAIGLVSVMTAPGLSALGLGEITLHSTLNQPLDAEIKLLQTRDLDKGEILAALASNDDFKRAGIERNYFLTGLTFSVDLKAAGGPVLRVRSDRQVQEPYLNFLVETRWPAGRILREYTLLMDLPVFTEDASPAVQTAKPAAPKPQNTVQRRPSLPAAATPKPSPKPKPEPRQAVQDEPESTSSYGPVGANETLWGIANQVRPNRGVSIQQTMLAIQRLNPDAFIDGNINRLRRGQVLRIPTESEVTRLSSRAAIAEVAQQNTVWSGNANGDVGAPIDAGSSKARRNASAEQATGRVKLASSSERQNGTSRGAGDGTAELSQAMEQLDKSRRENDELKSRLSDLEAQIETMERLVEVSSEQMRALQLSAAEKSQQSDSAGEEPSSIKAAAEDVIDPLNDAYKDSLNESPSLSELVPDEEAIVAQTEGESTEASPAEQEQPKVEKKKVAAVVSTPKAEPGLVDMLMANLLWIGGGLLAILLAVWAFLRQRSDDDDSENLEPQLDTSLETESTEDQVSVEADTDAESDVLSEADVYIAYGKFEQAESLLQEHLKDEPEDAPARLKLLEVYSEAKNYSAFNENAAALDGHGDVAVLTRVADLRDAMGSPEQASEALDGFGLEINDEEQSLDDLQLGSDVDEFDLGDMDFSLDQELDTDLGGIDVGLGDDLEKSSGVNDEPLIEDDSSEQNEGELSDIEFDLALGMGDEQDDSAVSADQAETAVLEDLDSKEDGLTDIEFESGLADLNTTEQADSDELDAEDALAALDDLSLENDAAVDSIDSQLDELDLDFSADDSVQETAQVETSSDSLLGLDKKTAEVAAAGAAALGATVVGTLTMHDEPEQAQADDEGSAAAHVEPNESFDLSAELDSGLEDELDLDAGGEFDLAELDKELDSELDLDAELSLDDSSSGSSADEDFSSDFGAELNELDSNDDLKDLAASGVDLPSSDLSVGDLAGNNEDLGDDLAALDISLGDEGDEAVAEELLSEPSNELSNELEFLADSDEVATKLDLARAYMDMGDKEGAREILEEVVNEGDDSQQAEAQELIDRMA